MNNLEIATALRDTCTDIRRRSYPIADLIPLLQQAADALTNATSLSRAIDVVTEAIRTDPDYAWGWQCNLAMATYDAGCSSQIANEGAARFLEILAKVDIRQNPYFAQTQQ